ncbi:MAG: EAL domain-containing protein [Lachnospiraceae bacterium]|nr:EAL domain-containing protein [Lachnospiraceae bacterium]
MSNAVLNYYSNYTPVGDILVIACCLVFAILFRTAYITRSKSFLIFRNILILMAVAAISNICYHYFSVSAASTPPYLAIYTFRLAFHLSIFGIFSGFVHYTKELLHLDRNADRVYLGLAAAGIVIAFIYDILGIAFHFGSYIDDAGKIHFGFNIFPILYVFYLCIIFYMILRNRTRIYKQIVMGVLLSSLVSLALIAIQSFLGQYSFTVATFLFPSFAILYLIHANPYDTEIGAVNTTAFEDLISHGYVHGRQLLIMSLFMRDFDVKGTKFPKDMQNTIRYYNHHFFKGALLFQISGGHIILVADIEKNPDYENRLKEMLGDFSLQYARFKYDYKIVFLKTLDEISVNNDYIGLIHYIEENMNEQEIKYVTEKDIEAYRKYNYIISELKDIHAKMDMDDKRIEVFCQPVLNIASGKYDTAEALMRMRLEKTGTVFPDQFIPIAEKYNYIHSLSLIILGKTCAEIKKMLDEGYKVKRISVNFSMIDVREADFCQNVNSIIEKSGIPFDKIAIELTESQSEKDFIIVKDKINELKGSGIKFYLDDFGTGYSNFDRIIELPFDIIKFDRSLVLASGSDTKSETMVSYLAHMFSDMNYSVLYEGIENEQDEDMCINMCARYLQGYKYSKPIPIAQLTEFFEKSTPASVAPL